MVENLLLDIEENHRRSSVETYYCVLRKLDVANANFCLVFQGRVTLVDQRRQVLYAKCREITLEAARPACLLPSDNAWKSTAASRRRWKINSCKERGFMSGLFRCWCGHHGDWRHITGLHRKLLDSSVVMFPSTPTQIEMLGFELGYSKIKRIRQ